MTKLKESAEIPVDKLIKGEYYHCHDRAGFIIFKFSRKNSKDRDRPVASAFIADMDGTTLRKESEFFITGRNTRKATQEEKDWLDHCISQNKFVELEKFRKEKPDKSFNIKYKSSDGTDKTENITGKTIEDAISKIKDFKSIHYYLTEE